MVKSVRKTPGRTRKKVAAKRGVTATRQAQPACDGQDLDEDFLAWRAWDEALLAAMDRLRGLKEVCLNGAYEAGCLFGKRWAEGADASELRLLANLRDKLDSESDSAWEKFFEECEDFEERENTAYGVRDALYDAIHPEHDGDRDKAREFWEAMIGAILRDAACPDALLKGFAERALEVWNKNKRQETLLG